MSQLKTVTRPAINDDINRTAGFNILHKNRMIQRERSGNRWYKNMTES